MDRQMLAVVIEPVKAEFGLSDLQIGLVSGLGFALSYSLLGVPLGRVADRHERRSLIAFTRGLGGLIAACGAGALGFWTLMASRAGAALSDAGGAPASLSMIADLYPPEQRSRAMSVFGVGPAVGSMLALVLGSWLANHWGWRTALALVGGSAIVLAIVLRMMTHEPSRSVQAGPATLLVVAGPGAVSLIWRQPVVRWLMVGVAFVLLAGYSFGAWNVSYLMRSHGLSLMQAGWISGLAAVGSVFGGLVAGMLADRLVYRYGVHWQMGVPLLGVTCAMFIGLMYFALPAGQVIAAAVMVFLFAFFISWWVAPTFAALSLIVPEQRRATASAMVTLSGSIVGSGLGIIITGSMSTWLTPLLHEHALRAALIGAVAMMSVSVYAYWQAMQLYASALREMDTSVVGTI